MRMMHLSVSSETSYEQRGLWSCLNPFHTSQMLNNLQKQQGELYIPDLQITHLDYSGKRYLIDVTTVNVTAATYRAAESRNPGAAAATAEGRKVREYKSKVDGRTTVLIPAAFEMSGRWGEGLISIQEGSQTRHKRERRT